MQIFLDCDGVLADFNSAATQVFNLPPREAKTRFKSDEFWRRIRAKGRFFRELPVLPDACELYDAIAHLEPIILTGCPHGGWAEPQKVAWAAQHFPGTKVITCESISKRLHMQPGDILVDDYVKYRGLWEEAGGIFIHHTSAQESIRQMAALGVPVRVGALK